jgi:hypothetical protein
MTALSGLLQLEVAYEQLEQLPASISSLQHWRTLPS